MVNEVVNPAEGGSGPVNPTPSEFLFWDEGDGTPDTVIVGFKNGEPVFDTVFVQDDHERPTEGGANG